MTEPACRDVDILVAAPGEVHQQQGLRAEFGAQLQRAGQRVRGFDRRDDPLGTAQQGERVHCLTVGDGAVTRPAGLGKPGMLRPDARIVEPSGNRVRVQGLAIGVLQQVGPHPVDHPGGAAGQRGRVPAGGQAVAARFTADQAHALVRDEGVEHADRVRPAAHAGDHGVRQASRRADHLLPGFNADDALKIPDHDGERVRAHHRADAVVGGLNRGNPVPEGRVDRVLERCASGAHRDNLGAEHPHPGHVQGLPPGVDLAHVHDAVQAEQRARRRGGHAMLASAGFGDHPGLPHPPGEQRLADDIVDLVRAGVREVLALGEDAAAAARAGGERGNLGEQGRPARVAAQQCPEFGLEAGV